MSFEILFFRQKFLVRFLLYLILLNMQFVYRKYEKIFSNVYWRFHVNKKHGKFHEATEKVWHVGFREKMKTRKMGGVDGAAHHCAVEYVPGLIAT
jgi:hypothetical protein